MNWISILGTAGAVVSGLLLGAVQGWCLVGLTPKWPWDEAGPASTAAVGRDS